MESCIIIVHSTIGPLPTNFQKRAFDKISSKNVLYSESVVQRERPAAADPGFLEGGGLITIFTSGGGYGRGRAPPVTARWSGGAL